MPQKVHPLRLWAVLFSIESLLVLLSVSTSSKLAYRANGKAFLLVLIAFLGLCVAAFIAALIYVAQEPTTRERVVKIGIRLVVLSLLWLLASIAVVYADIQSITLGLFSIAGVAMTLPLAGVGGSLILAGSLPTRN